MSAEAALHKANGACQAAVITLLLDHGADVHAVTGVRDCRTSFGVFSVPSFIFFGFKNLTLL